MKLEIQEFFKNGVIACKRSVHEVKWETGVRYDA